MGSSFVGKQMIWRECGELRRVSANALIEQVLEGTASAKVVAGVLRAYL